MALDFNFGAMALCFNFGAMALNFKFGGMNSHRAAHNARNMQAALRIICEDEGNYVNIGCCVRLLNLLTGDLFKSIDVLKAAMSDMDELIKNGEVEQISAQSSTSKFRRRKARLYSIHSL